MKSHVCIRTRLLTTVSVVVLVTLFAPLASLAQTKAPEARAQANPTDGQKIKSDIGDQCSILVAPFVHVVPGSSTQFKTYVTVGGGATCGWTYADEPNWLGTYPAGNVLNFMTDVNVGAPRIANVKVKGLVHYSGVWYPTGDEVTVKVTQQTLACTYSFDKTSFSFPNGPVIGFFNVSTNAEECARNAKSNVSWLTITNGSNLQGSGPIGYAMTHNQGPARTGKITLGNATATFTQGGGCLYELGSPGKTFDAGGGTGAINVSASDSDCPRDFKSNASWLIVTSGSNLTGSGPVTYAVAPNYGSSPRSAKITRAGSDEFNVIQNGDCTFSISPSIFNFQGGNGTSQIQVTASSSSCAWSPQSGASWVKITSPSQINGSGNVSFTVDPNPNSTARNTTIKIGGKTATINQTAQAVDCTFTVTPLTQQVAVGGGEFTVNVTGNSACKWFIGGLSPFVQVVNFGMGGGGNGSFKLKVLPNPGAARSGKADVAGKTITINQDGATPQTLLITYLDPEFATAGSPELLLIIKGINFTNACKVRWNGSERFTSYYNSSTLAAIISPGDIDEEGVANISVTNSSNGAQSNIEQFHIYGPLTNVSSASYKGEAIAPDSLVSGFGSDLAQTLKVANVSPLPTELEGTTVTINDAAGAQHQAQIFFVSGNQVNYYMPASVALGKATVTIKSGSGHVSGSTVNIEPVAPGIFSVDATGKGLGAILAVRVKADGTQIYEATNQFDPNTGQFKPVPIDLVVPGEVVYLAIFGTGFRNRISLAAVKIDLGGVAGTAAYAGETPGYLGLDQLNLIAPVSLTGKGEIDIKVTVDGKVANTVRLAFK